MKKELKALKCKDEAFARVVCNWLIRARKDNQPRPFLPLQDQLIKLGSLFMNTQLRINGHDGLSPAFSQEEPTQRPCAADARHCML
jgi:hypothetical protein